MRLSPLSLSLLLALGGCSLAPTLPKPALPVPDTYGTAPADEAADKSADASAAAIGWRRMFGDPRLQRLIEVALEHNRDLRLAVLNVSQVQAQYDIQRSYRVPGVDAGLEGSRQRSSSDGGNSTAIQETRSASLGVSAFEVDLFGRVGSLSEAAFARYLASEHGLRAARLSLIGAVAEAYFAERLAEEQLRLTELTLADWRQSLDLARKLKLAQQSSGLDIAQAEGQVATAEADLESRQRALAQARNGLALLLGTEPPADLPPPTPLAQQPVLTQLPPGLPSDLLAHRPDIQQAEQALIAANADIGAARAAFFPRLLLTLSVGAISPSFGSLFPAPTRPGPSLPRSASPSSRAGACGPNCGWPNCAARPPWSSTRRPSRPPSAKCATASPAAPPSAARSRPRSGPWPAPSGAGSCPPCATGPAWTAAWNCSTPSARPTPPNWVCWNCGGTTSATPSASTKPSAAAAWNRAEERRST